MLPIQAIATTPGGGEAANKVCICIMHTVHQLAGFMLQGTPAAACVTMLCISIETPEIAGTAAVLWCDLCHSTLNSTAACAALSAGTLPRLLQDLPAADWLGSQMLPRSTLKYALSR
jgi:hypothetical protein